MPEPPRREALSSAPPVDPIVRSAALVKDLPVAFAATVFDPRDPALTAVFMAGSRTTILRTGELPLSMRREISWWLARCDGSGERSVHASEWNRWVATAVHVIARRPSVSSFADLTLAEWMTAWGRVFHTKHGRLASAGSRYRAQSALGGLLRPLLLHYSDADWWRHDTWSLKQDGRIPRREHEPRANTAVRWADIEPDWLREGMKFYLRLQLESGQLTWSTVMPQRGITARFAAFVADRSLDHPALVADPITELRGAALAFGTFLHSWRRRHPGRDRVGGPLLPGTIAKTQQAIALFYRVMTDYRVEAARELGDDRWLALTDSHARLYRPEDYPRGRAIRQADEQNYITDTDLARMLAHVELLGLPRAHTLPVLRDGEAVPLAGMGQPAVMRAWLLQALTGRRAAEVLMMDFDPLLEVVGLDPATVGEGGPVAKLRYQQTKVDGAPSTILVGADVVQIVGEQQAWVRERWKLGPHDQMRYLFPATTRNRRGTKAWETSNYDHVLLRFSDLVDLRDSNGRPLRYSRSHRLRHTKATTLLNAGAPIHVVQRYLGHRSPEMTMRYAATLASTAEREFLTLAKVGRDGRELGMDRRDMLDLVQLGQRTDRVLPNGYCLLPPTKSCDKGNACHGCDHFATDRSHLGEICRQLADTEALVATRQAQHTARYGEPMSENNVWLEQRHAEIRSMQREITALEAQPEGIDHAIRGAGVRGRTGYIPGPVPVTITNSRTSR